MKRLLQVLGFVGLLAIAGCEKNKGVYSPDQAEHEARAQIIQGDYLSKPREKFGRDRPAPNYPMDRLFDKYNLPRINGL